MLETRDLILQKGKPEDWKAMYENVWRHEETARYMMWRPKKTEQEGFEMTQGHLAFQAATPTAYFVYEKTTMKPIGFAGMKETAPGIYEDAGIAVGPDFSGKGYGKQILLVLLQQAFEFFGAEKFVYSCWAENIPSNRLAAALGFRLIRTAEMVDPRSGTPFVMNYYEKERGTWQM